MSRSEPRVSDELLAKMLANASGMMPGYWLDTCDDLRDARAELAAMKEREDRIVEKLRIEREYSAAMRPVVEAARKWRNAWGTYSHVIAPENAPLIAVIDTYERGQK